MIRGHGLGRVWGAGMHPMPSDAVEMGEWSFGSCALRAEREIDSDEVDEGILPIEAKYSAGGEQLRDA